MIIDKFQAVVERVGTVQDMAAEDEEKSKVSMDDMPC